MEAHRRIEYVLAPGENLSGRRRESRMGRGGSVQSHNRFVVLSTRFACESRIFCELPE